MDQGDCEEFIKVAVRCRPQSLKEKEYNYSNVVDISSNAKDITINCTKMNSLEYTPYHFQFETIFNQNSTQEQIYKNIGYPIIEDFIKGYNGTIYAYGQTGSGKTFTLQGCLDYQELHGIIPRAIDHIFSRIEQISRDEQDLHFKISANMIKLSSEEIYDLLSEQQSPQNLKFDLNGDMSIENLIKKEVKNSKELLDIFNKGWTNNMIYSTNFSLSTSFSFVVFQIFLEKYNEKKDKLFQSTLNIIDFCGSELSSNEKICKQLKQSIETFIELVNESINLKLEQQIYNKSIITRLMKQSLGGNSKTVMICNINPSDINIQETIQTLNIGQRVMKIKNNVKLNAQQTEIK